MRGVTSRFRRAYAVLLVAFVAAILGRFSIVSGMVDIHGKWIRTRQDDELIALAMASRDRYVGVVYLAETPEELESLLDKIRSLDGRVAFVDNRVGYIRATVPTRSVRDAIDVPSGDVASVDLDLSYHVPNGFTNMAPPSQQNVADIERKIRSSGTRRVLSAPSPILHDLGADQWSRSHPTFDGRGVTIADVESGLVDPAVPELRHALSLDGKPIRKIEGIHMAFSLNDPSSPRGGSDYAPQWIRMTATVRGARGFSYQGRAYQFPYGGVFRIGTFDLEKAVADSSDGVVSRWMAEQSICNPCTVLWDKARGLVWVDAHDTRDFRRVHPLRDFNRSGDWSYFGSLQRSPHSLTVSFQSFVILERPEEQSIAVGLALGTHLVGVLSSAAGSPVGPNDPVHGVAPSAQVASFEFEPFKLHSQAEALISAFEDPHTDIIVFETSAAIYPQSLEFRWRNEDGWFLGALGARLVSKFDKPLFVPAGDLPLFSAVGDEGIASNVISVDGWQSAASYRLYYGLRLSGHVYMPFGALQAGPGQDGALKPDLLAPADYIAASRRNFWNAFYEGRPGQYTLPAGYWLFGGTSQATPTAAGAAALILSGAKQEGFHVSAALLEDALRLGARVSTELPAYQQGNGLLDVDRAWRILHAQLLRNDESPGTAYICRGLVRTGTWPHGTPNGGRGLLETIGWSPGDVGIRTVIFCLSHAYEPISVSLVLNDGTYRITSVRVSGNTADVSIRIQPREAGIHSALLELRTRDNRLLGRGMLTIAAAASLTYANHNRVTQIVSVPQPGFATTVVHVQPGTTRLLIQGLRSAPFVFAAQDPNGNDYTGLRIDASTLTLAYPSPGNWTILLVDIHHEFDMTSVTSLLRPAAARVTFTAIHAPANGQQPIANGKGTIRTAETLLFPFVVSSTTSPVLIDLAGSDPGVDGYLFGCQQRECLPVGELTGVIPDKRLLTQLPPGHYTLALDRGPFLLTQWSRYAFSITRVPHRYVRF